MSRRPVYGEWHRSFTRWEKAQLILEIVATYVRVRRLMSRHQLVETLAALRMPRVEASALTQIDAGRTGLRLGSAVRRTLTALPTDSRCLMRALVLSGLLAQRGIDSSLVIGVRTEPNFGAHAWVEYDGVPLLPAGEESMGRLADL